MAHSHIAVHAVTVSVGLVPIKVQWKGYSSMVTERYGASRPILPLELVFEPSGKKRSITGFDTDSTGGLLGGSPHGRFKGLCLDSGG